jgi:hypothetical protein
LKKSVRKRSLEPRAFVYSLAHLPFYFRVSIYERLSAHNSARALKVEGSCIPVRGTVNRSPDNRVSTLVSTVLVNRPIHSHLTERFYCETSYLTEKLSKLRSFDRKYRRTQNCPFQSSFTWFTQRTPKFPQFTCRHHDGIT